MNPPTAIIAPLSRRRIVILTLSAAGAAMLILFGAVLPAEYNRDPTGLGRLTGIASLWAPVEIPFVPATGTAVKPAQSDSTPFRTDVIEILLQPSGTQGSEIEYKVHLKQGSSYVYDWRVEGVADPDEFYTEFHGHTVVAGRSMTVADYRKESGTADRGTLRAPFDGVHGWYFQNQSLKPVTVRLRLAGFYSLVPAGQPGNEAGLSPLSR